MRRRAHLPIYVAALLATLAVASLAKAQTQSADQTARRTCAADIQTLCPPAVRGSGGLGQCMLDHMDAVSPECRKAIDDAKAARAAAKMRGDTPPAQTPPPPATSAPGSIPQSR